MRRSLRLPSGEGGDRSAERKEVDPAHAYFPWHTFWSAVSKKGANGHPT